MSLHHWLVFVASFLIVLAVLTVLSALQEWLEWRRKP